MPKLSIITPIYNSEEYLEKCLKNLVAQSLEDIEFVWVDNGASEECKDIIKKYKNHRKGIRIINIPENIGYCGAMNKGVDIATGDYVGFCDSDDWVDEDYFEKLHSIAKKNNADIVYAQYIEHHGEATKFVTHISFSNMLTTICKKFDAMRNGAVWDKIFKRSLVVEHNVRFPASHISFYQDNVFLVQALIPAQNVICTWDAYYHYRIVPTSTIRMAATKRERERYAIELAGILSQYAGQYNFSQEEKNCYFHFILRTLDLKYLIKKNKFFIDNIKNLKWADIDFALELKKIYRMYHPSISQRLFSVHVFNGGSLIYFFGFKIKFKNKRKIF